MLSFAASAIDEGMSMEHWMQWYARQETEVFGKKPVPMSLCPKADNMCNSYKE